MGCSGWAEVSTATSPAVAPADLAESVSARSAPRADSRDLQRADVAATEGPARAGRGWAIAAVVGGTTGIAAVVGALWIRPPFGATLLLVAGLVALLESRGPVAVSFGRGRFLFSGTAYASIGAVFLLGLPAAAVSSFTCLVMGLAVHLRSPEKTLFNGAMSFLATSAAFAAFEGMRHLLVGMPLEWVILAGAVGGLAAWLVNHLLLGMVLVADRGRRNMRFQAFARSLMKLLPFYVGYGLTGVGVLAASRWIFAPGALITLAAPVAIVQTSTNRWMREQQARLSEARSGFNATLVSLSKAIDLRDSDTEGHCRRVVEYSLMMGRFLKFDDDDLIRLCHGALLHDIGKIGVPDAILHKPGPLTEQEWDVMRTHPQLGALLVADVQQLEKAREVILNHHERVDGKGYPGGLSGEAIPLAARVFTIADAFDAMISDRPYRKAMSLEDARREVRRCSGTQFDTVCVTAFDSLTDDELRAVGRQKEQPTEELLSL